MLKNYLKVAARYLLKHKGYTAINILGLAVGIASCILIMLFVKSEWSYDRFHSKSDHIYRVWLQENYGPDEIFTNIATPLPLGPRLKSDIPDVAASCRVLLLPANVKTANQTSDNENINMVDSSFFEMFDFGLSQGNRNAPFPTSNSTILTKALAKKYFGSTDPIGQNLDVQLGETIVTFTVSGIIDHVPEESSIRFDMLISFDNAHYIFGPRQMQAWQQVYTETYVLLKNPTTDEAFAPKFDGMVKQISGDEYKAGQYNLHLQPIADIHLNPSLPAGNYPTSSPLYSYVLACIGILILLIACINFITLSIGRSTTRALEVGVRKVLGAERQQLMQQFWMEAFLFTVISVIIGLLVAVLLLNPFNSLFQKHLSFAPDPVVLLFFCVIIVFITLVAGVYPSVVLSAFNPTEVFKGKSKGSGSMGLFRRSLIAGQFIASISMIICTLVISRQLNYLQNKDLGYKKDHVVIVPTNQDSDKGYQIAALYQNELSKIPQVKSVSTSLCSFSEPGWVELGFTGDDEKYHKIRMNAVDENFLPAMDIALIDGRNFQKDNSADHTGGAIVNEAFVKEFGLTDPIGKKLPGRFKEQVIGVVKDFNFESLHTKIEPLVLTMKWDSMLRYTEDVMFSSSTEPRVSVRMAGGDLNDNILLLQNAWKKIVPNQNFDYHFLDESLAAQYREDQRVSKIILVASALAIFIACMGLFGLATLVVNRRTKEIGIRKILGAGYASIISLVSKDFVVIVIIAAVIAFPLAFYAMDKWLQNFEYRTVISWWIFLLAAIVALVVTLLTVGFHAMRVAVSNPVKNLRTE